MINVLFWLVVVVVALAALLILLWALLELFQFVRWIFPANKDDEAGPFK